MLLLLLLLRRRRRLLLRERSLQREQRQHACHAGGHCGGHRHAIIRLGQAPARNRHAQGYVPR